MIITGAHLNLESFCPPLDIVFFLSEVTGLQATPTGLMWLAPSNVPMTCFPQYIISLTEDPTVNLTVSSNRASSADLNARGFPYCTNLSMTVTPILYTGAPLTSSSASTTVAINDPGTIIIDYAVKDNYCLSLQSV